LPLSATRPVTRPRDLFWSPDSSRSSRASKKRAVWRLRRCWACVPMTRMPAQRNAARKRDDPLTYRCRRSPGYWDTGDAVTLRHLLLSTPMVP